MNKTTFSYFLVFISFLIYSRYFVFTNILNLLIMKKSALILFLFLSLCKYSYAQTWDADAVDIWISPSNVSQGETADIVAQFKNLCSYNNGYSGEATFDIRIIVYKPSGSSTQTFWNNVPMGYHQVLNKYWNDYLFTEVGQYTIKSEIYDINGYQTNWNLDNRFDYRIETFNITEAVHNPVASFYLSCPSDLFPTKSYTIKVNYTDENGRSDLQNGYLRLAQGSEGSNPVTLMLHNFSGNPSQWAGETQAVENLSASVTNITNGYRVTWNFEMKWNWSESTNVDYWAFAIDDAGGESTHVKENENADYENDIRIYTSSENDDPVIAGNNYTVTGQLRFEGSSSYPSDWSGISVEMRKNSYTGALLDTDGSVSNGYSVTWNTNTNDIGNWNVYIKPRNTNHQPNNSSSHCDIETVTVTNEGNIKVYVKDMNNTLVGSGHKVEIFNNNYQTLNNPKYTNSSGYAYWSDLSAANYKFEAYVDDNSTIWGGDCYWGGTDGAVTAGSSSSANIIQVEPFVETISVSGSSFIPGDIVHVDVTVQNNTSASQNVKAEIIIDMGQSSPWNYESSLHGPITISANDEGYFGFDWEIPANASLGTYHISARTQRYFQTAGSWGNTDATGWEESFNVTNPNGNIKVYVKDMNNTLVGSGHKVEIFNNNYQTLNNPKYTNSSGYAYWSDLSAANYKFEAYVDDNSTIWGGDCYWGGTDGAITAGSTSSANIIQVEPFVETISVSGSSFMPGDIVHVDVTVQNNTSASQNVKAEIIIDLGQSSPWNHESGLHGPITISANDEGYFGFDWEIPANTSLGTYHITARTQRYFQTAGSWGNTDATGWEESFIVEEGGGPSTIQFAGLTWNVKNGSGMGPGPNNWSNSTSNVWVDSNGDLHLKIRKIGDEWYCSEVWTEDSFGYGEYKFQLKSPLENYDKNVVVGLFTYLTDTEEIDIEFSKWGNNAVTQVGNYVVQPGNLEMFDPNMTGDYSSHRFVWLPDEIQYKSWHGHASVPSPDVLMHEWVYTGNDNPTPSNEKLHLNFWLMSGNAPSNQQEAEIIISSVQVKTTGFAEFFVYDGDISGNPASGAFIACYGSNNPTGVTDNNGYFSDDLIVEHYYYDVYNQELANDERELWASSQFTISPIQQVSEQVEREFPRATDLYAMSDNGNIYSAPGDVLYVNTGYNMKIPVLNNSAWQNTNTRVKIILDEDQQPPYDEESVFYSEIINLGQSNTFSIPFNLNSNLVGTNLFIKVICESELNNTWILTDLVNWNELSAFVIGENTDLPIVTDLLPADGQENIPIDFPFVSVTFNKPMDFSTINNQTFIVEANGQTVSGLIEQFNDYTYTLSFNEDLAYGTEYQCKLSADIKDIFDNPLDGNENGIVENSPIDDIIWNFVTADNSNQVSNTFLGGWVEIANLRSIEGENKTIKDLYLEDNKKQLFYLSGGEFFVGVGIYIDLADYYSAMYPEDGVSEEGEAGWITVWVDGSVGLAWGLPGGMGLTPPVEFEPPAYDPKRSMWTIDAINASLPFVNTNAISWSFNNQLNEFEFDWGNYDFSPVIDFSATVVSLHNNVARFEIQKETLDELFDIVITAAIPQGGIINTTSGINIVSNSIIDEIVNINNWKVIPAIFDPSTTRQFTITDNNIRPNLQGSLSHIRGGIDINGDNVPDNRYRVIPSVLSENLDPTTVSFYNEGNIMSDFKIKLLECPSGWHYKAYGGGLLLMYDDDLIAEDILPKDWNEEIEITNWGFGVTEDGLDTAIVKFELAIKTPWYMQNIPLDTIIDTLFKVDISTNLPSSLTLLEPNTLTNINQGQDLLINWQDGDPDDNASISLFIDPDLNNTPWEGVENHYTIPYCILEDPDGDIEDSYNWLIDNIPAGTYSVWGVIYDGAHDGVYSKASGNINIIGDYYPENPFLISPDNESVILSLIPEFSWSEFQPGEDSEEQTGYELRVYNYGDIVYETGFVPGTNVTNHIYSPGYFTGVDPVTGFDRISLDLTQGNEYNWMVRVIDIGGQWSNWSNDTQNNRFVFYSENIPNEIPIITISNPNQGDILNNEVIVVTGSALDQDNNGQIVQIEIKLNNNDWELTTGTESWTHEITLEEGENTIYAKAIDDLGGQGFDQVTVTYTPSTSLVANFTSDITQGAAPLTVQFTDNSTGTPTTWQWDFDNDGTIDSNIEDPEWTYDQVGTYTVSLTVGDGTNNSTKTEQDYINVLPNINNNIALQTLGATADDNGSYNDNGTALNALLTIDNDPITFWAGLQNASPQQMWINFDQSYEIDKIYISERVVAYSLTGEVEYYDGSNWQSLFTINKTSPDIIQSFSPIIASGVRLTVNTLVAPATWSNKVACVYSFEVNGEAISNLTADFSADQTSGAAPLTVQFTDNSTGTPTTWQWDFDNDGTIDSYIQDPEWTYNVIGVYTVSLTVSDGTNNSTKTEQDYINVLPNQNNGLVAYYPFNGNANDESGNGNDGTVIGPVLANDRFGNPNSAYQFDGSNDYINCGNGSSINIAGQGAVITMSCWVKTNNASTHQYLISKGRDYTTNQGYHIDIPNNKPRGLFRLSNNTNCAPQTIDNIESGVWYHLASTYDGTIGKIYVNGILVNSMTMLGEIGTSSTNLILGCHSPSPPTWYKLNGILDEVRIFDRLLSDAEILQLYQNSSELDAIFEANITTGEAPLTVQFTGNSTGIPTSWAWDFDNDGTIDSDLEDPEWIYNQAGTYTVSLTVSDGTYSDTEVKIDYIEVFENPTNLSVIFISEESGIRNLWKGIISNNTITNKVMLTNYTEGLVISYDVCDVTNRIVVNRRIQESGTDHEFLLYDYSGVFLNEIVVPVSLVQSRYIAFSPQGDSIVFSNGTNASSGNADLIAAKCCIDGTGYEIIANVNQPRGYATHKNNFNWFDGGILFGDSKQWSAFSTMHEIYLYDNNGVFTNFTNTGGNGETSPILSPLHDSLVFITLHNSYGQGISKMQYGGGTQEVIFPNSTSERYMVSEWLTSDQILYSKKLTSGNYDIYSMSSTGSNIVNLTNTSAFNEFNIKVFSPQTTVNEIAIYPNENSHMISSYYTLNNQIYYFGGYQGGTYYICADTISVWDIPSGQWSSPQITLPYGIFDFHNHAIHANDQFYLTPGFASGNSNGWGSHRKLIDIDLNNLSASETHQFVSNRIWNMSSCYWNNKIFFFGGHNGSDLKTIYEYDIGSDNLQVIGEMGYTRNAPSVILGNDEWIYIFGDNSIIERFNPQTYVSETLSPSFPIGSNQYAPHFWHIPLEDAIYFFKSNTDNPEIFKYNYADQQLTQTGSFLSGKFSNIASTRNATDASVIYSFKYGTPNNFPLVLCEIKLNEVSIESVDEMLDLENITVSNGQTQCYNATNTITVAGSGTTVDINSGGEATFIAGEKILFETGFSAHQGSYVQAYITTTNEYCNQQQSMMAANSVINEDGGTKALNIDALDDASDELVVNIYPNPTTGNFTIDFIGKETTADITVLNFQGNKIRSLECNSQVQAEVDISYLPAGMYIIVIKTETDIIKKKLTMLK